MNKIIFKILIGLLMFVVFSCKKDSLDDMFLTDGMMVFNLDGKDWIVHDLIASYSDLTGIGGGQIISISGSIQVNIDIYKSILLNIKDLDQLSNKNYPFSVSQETGSSIEIDEGKTISSGISYRSINPESNLISTGNIKISNFDRIANTITGSFSGEVFKTNYSDNSNDGWVKTSIKSGRFNNIPVIEGK